MTDTIDAISFDGIVVDPESGEIIEGLDPNDTERLVALARDAKEQAKTWELRHDIFRRILERKLSDANVRKLETAAGVVTIRSRVTLSAKVTETQLADMQEAYGIEDLAMDEVISSAVKELDVDKLRKVWAYLELDPKGLSDLITESRAGWVQVDPVRKVASRAEKVQVPA